MLKFLLVAVLFYQASSCERRPEIPAAAATPNTNRAVIQPAPAATPITGRILSECTKNRAVGLAADINIPEELCFNANREVDEKERSDAKSGNNAQTSTIEGFDLPFDQLPAEVRNIIKITAPQMDVNAVVFDLTVIPTADTIAKNRLVKSYSYASSSKNKTPGKDPNRHTWLFKRQNNLLKLDYAEISAAGDR